MTGNSRVRLEPDSFAVTSANTRTTDKGIRCYEELKLSKPRRPIDPQPLNARNTAIFRLPSSGHISEQGLNTNESGRGILPEKADGQMQNCKNRRYLKHYQKHNDVEGGAMKLFYSCHSSNPSNPSTSPKYHGIS